MRIGLIHKLQDGLHPLRKHGDQLHKHQEGFPILTLEIIQPKEELLLIIILIEEQIRNLLIDEVIVPLEIIPLMAQVELVVMGLHLEVQIVLVAIVLHLEVVHHQDQHHRLQEVHLLQEVVQEVLEKIKKN